MRRLGKEVRVQHRTEALAQANKTLDLELRERRQAEDRIRGLMERLITVQEDERRRIARDLHDQVGQTLSALMRQAGCASGFEVNYRTWDTDEKT